MNRAEQEDARMVLESTIIAEVSSPAEWLSAVHRIASRLGLRTARFLPLPCTLQTACLTLVDEAAKQGVTFDRLVGALKATFER